MDTEHGNNGLRCVICGAEEKLDMDGICPACVTRYGLGEANTREHLELATDPHVDADWGPTKEALDLAERVRDEVQPWHQVAYKDGLSLDLVDHIISSALAQIARDVRQGKHVTVEYLGKFWLRHGVLSPTNTEVEFVPDNELAVPWPTNLHEMVRREEAA